jgi:hypothetical protein
MHFFYNFNEVPNSYTNIPSIGSHHDFKNLKLNGWKEEMKLWGTPEKKTSVQSDGKNYDRPFRNPEEAFTYASEVMAVYDEYLSMTEDDKKSEDKKRSKYLDYINSVNTKNSVERSEVECGDYYDATLLSFYSAFQNVSNHSYYENSVESSGFIKNKLKDIQLKSPIIVKESIHGVGYGNWQLNSINKENSLIKTKFDTDKRKEYILEQYKLKEGAAEAHLMDIAIKIKKDKFKSRSVLYKIGFYIFINPFIVIKDSIADSIRVSDNNYVPRDKFYDKSKAQAEHDNMMAVMGVPTGSNGRELARWGKNIHGHNRMDD